MTLETFAEQYCDQMYTPGIPEEHQCTGYKTLKAMVESKQEPSEENLRAFHPNLRVLIVKHWDSIKELRNKSEQ